MNVADAMTPRSEVVTVELPGTRDDVLTYLQERAFSSVPVVKDTDDGEQFRGLVSREDLIATPDEDQLALLMSEVPTTEQGASIEDLARLMVEQGARRVPVVDGKLEGIVTVTDVIRAIAEGEVAGDAEVGDLATRTVNTVWRETPLAVAERTIAHAGIPYAVVLDDDGRMDGIITEVDVIDVARVVAGEAETGDSVSSDDEDWKWENVKAVGSTTMPTRDVEIPTGPVSDFMTEDVVTVTKGRTAREAAQLMIEHDVEQIPLMTGGHLGGVVTDMDLLEGLYE